MATLGALKLYLTSTSVLLGSALLAMAIGLLVLVGWALGLDAVKSVIPGAVQMKPNAALCLVFAGMALGLDATRSSRRARRLRLVLALVVAGIGGATLMEYETGRNFGLDEFLWYDRGHAFNAAPGRMSFFCAVAFVLSALALALRGKSGWRSVIGIACAALVALIGAVAVIGYIWNAQELVTDTFSTPVALPAGVAFVALGGAFLVKFMMGPQRKIIELAQIDHPLKLGFFGILALLLVTASFTYRSNIHFSNAAHRVAHTQEVRVELERLSGCMNQARALQRRYLLLGDEVELTAFALHGAECRRSVERLGALVSDNAQQKARASALAALVEQGLRQLAEQSRVPEQYESDAERQALLRGISTDVSRTVVLMVKEMNAVEEGLLSERLATLASQRLTMLVSLLATWMISTGVFALLVRAMLQKVRESEQLRRVAEDAARTKTDFLSNMSHEIRTPMTGVLGMIDLLAAEPLDDRQKGYVTALRSSGQHLLSLINDILDLSRLEAGGIEIEQVDFSLSKVIEHARSLMHPVALDRRVRLDFHVDRALPKALSGDPKRITQVLLNLVSNAIKFTEHGSVEVTVSLCHSPSDAASVRFEVRDTGIGLAPEALARLFAPFVQADSSTARRYGGSGLGLVISKRLVEAMGGVIGVKSELGRGSCFHFEVPLHLALTPIEASPGTPRAAFKAPPCRILVAEDVAINRDILRVALERQGHHVTFAEDGAVALKLARAGGWDVILMDVQMPVMDGLEASRQIRLLPGVAGRVPIVGLTANVLTVGRERYRAAGMDDCLDKPIDWSLLDSALARFAPVPVAAVEKRILDDLRQALGVEEAQQLMEAGIQAYRGYCDAIERDIATPSAVASHAHKIKGSAGTLGMAPLTQAAGEVEAAALLGEVRSACVDSLRALLLAAETEIRLALLAPMPIGAAAPKFDCATRLN